MNLRVLIGSMVIAIVVGVVLIGGFWHKTPARVDASSGGNPSQNTEQAAPPSAATPQPGAGGAPEASPAPTTPSPAPEPSTP